MRSAASLGGSNGSVRGNPAREEIRTRAVLAADVPLNHAAQEADPGQRGIPCPRSPYLLVEDVAARLRCSRRTVHELTRTGAIPHRRLPGSRRCLFLEAELVSWADGAELEVLELAGGGRVVRPKGST